MRPVISVPTRYGQRRCAGARHAATSSTTQIAATESVCDASSAATARAASIAAAGTGLKTGTSARARRRRASWRSRRRARGRSRSRLCGSRHGSRDTPRAMRIEFRCGTFELTTPCTWRAIRCASAASVATTLVPPPSTNGMRIGADDDRDAHRCSASSGGSPTRGRRRHGCAPPPRCGRPRRRRRRRTSRAGRRASRRRRRSSARTGRRSGSSPSASARRPGCRRDRRGSTRCTSRASPRFCVTQSVAVPCSRPPPPQPVRTSASSRTSDASRHGVRANRARRGRADQQPGVLAGTEVGAVHRDDRLLRADVPLHAATTVTALPLSSYAVAV